MSPAGKVPRDLNSFEARKWLEVVKSLLDSILVDGSFTPPSLADSAAQNNSLYYSTTATKLVYKDSGGVVHALY